MSDSLQSRIEAAEAAFETLNGHRPKALLIGAKELAEFIEEFFPALDSAEEVTSSQFVQFLKLRVVVVMKTTYLGVA